MKSLRPFLLLTSLALLIIGCVATAPTTAKAEPPPSAQEPVGDAIAALGGIPASMDQITAYVDAAVNKKMIAVNAEMAGIKKEAAASKADAQAAQSKLSAAQAAITNTETFAKGETKRADDSAKAAADKAKADAETMAKMQKDLDWNTQYGDRLFNLSWACFVGAALVGIAFGASFIPNPVGLALALARPITMLAAPALALIGILGMQYLEYHKDIATFLKWGFIGLLLVGGIAIIFVLLHKGSLKKVEVATKTVEADAAATAAQGREKVLAVLAQLKADPAFGPQGVLNLSTDKTAIATAYAKLPSEFHSILDDFLSAAKKV